MPKVAPHYAADLSVPILDCCQNAKERVIGSSTMYSVHCTCVDLIISNYLYKNLLLKLFIIKKIYIICII